MAMADQASTDTPIDPFKALLDNSAVDAWRKSAFHQLERFWECQNKLLDEYRAFSQALLERRRAATEATLDTVRKMCACNDNTEWMKHCTDWLSGSFSRLAADGNDVLQESMRMMAEVSQTMSAGMAETAEVSAATREAQSRFTSLKGAAIAETATAMQEAAARAAKGQSRFKQPDESPRP
jgi:hypothetical protein